MQKFGFWPNFFRAGFTARPPNIFFYPPNFGLFHVKQQSNYDHSVYCHGGLAGPKTLVKNQTCALFFKPSIINFIFWFHSYSSQTFKHGFWFLPCPTTLPWTTDGQFSCPCPCSFPISKGSKDNLCVLHPILTISTIPPIK